MSDVVAVIFVIAILLALVSLILPLADRFALPSAMLLAGLGMVLGFAISGLGHLPESALRIRQRYAAFDAERLFDLPEISAPDAKSCECGAIVRGLKHPRDCKLFGNGCTPEHPIGSCMVSSEGACAAHYSYGRFREASASA